MNIFYFLDSLCETSLLAKAKSQQQSSVSFYVDYLPRDLAKIVDSVVPEGRQGLPNVMNTRQVRAICTTPKYREFTSYSQILESWRSKRIIDPQMIDDILQHLRGRTASDPEPPPSPALRGAPTMEEPSLARTEVFRRIEEDRERHKRLRERRWVQPTSHHSLAQLFPPPLATFLPLDSDVARKGLQPGAGWGPGEELTIDIEFENEWETTSDWNEDDDEAALEENALCFLPERGATASMDVP
jgi:CTD kinase subunit gamma